MKRILLILTMVSISVSAQMSEKMKVDNQKKSIQQQKLLKPSNTFSSKSVSLWSDDFSEPSNWVIEHDSTLCDLDWQIGVNLINSGQFPTDPIESTTASNGYAMIDSDGYAQEQGTESSWMTTANSIDLSSENNIILQFETWYRAYNNEACFVVVSTNNSDWPELNAQFDASSNPNVFEVFPDISELESNPELFSINISSVAGGQETVWIRFHWTGTYGYSWFVDDASISQLQANDIILNYGYVSGGGPVEYGRIPESQVSDTLILGGEVLNFGSESQFNISVESSISNSSGNEIISVTALQDSLESDSVAYIEDFVTGFTPLAVGSYTLDVLATSEMDNSSGNYFNDNSYSRNFEITDNVYSIDGIDIYENADENLAFLGSNSFTDNEDGLIIMNWYEINTTTRLNGLEVAIATNSQMFSAGAEIVPFMLSFESWDADDYYNRLVEGDFISVSDWNLNQGIIWLPFEETVLEPGIYFACVELYSGAGDNHVGILDDETVAQPWYATSIYLPSDQTSYSNGSAAAIRLGLDNYVSIKENETNNLVSISPNPSNGLFTVTSNTSDIKTLEVVNILGELIESRIIDGVVNETFDMTSFSAGMYFVKSSNGISETTQRVIIK